MSQQDEPVVEDTGLSEAVETVDNDVELEDIEISFDDVEDTDTEEAATESEEEVTPSTTEEETVEETEPEVEEEKSEEATDEEPEAVELDPIAERKRFNDEMAKQRIAEREARAEAKRAQEALEATHIQNYLAEARDDPEEFAQRELNVEAYKLQQERISLNAEKLQVGIDKALASIDIFVSGTDAAKEEMLAALDEFEAQYVVKDSQGRPVEVKGDVLAHLQKKAASIRKLQQDGATRQAKSKDEVKSRTVATPSRTPKQPKVDSDLEGFDEEANRW